MGSDQNLSVLIRDIKPPMEIPDNSFYYYWGLIGFGAVLVALVLFFVIKKFVENRQSNRAKEYLAALKAIDWQDSKASAYQATYYASRLATDERSKEIFSQLEPMLMQYKYKKVVDEADEKTRNQLDLFIKVVDESI